MQIKKATPGVWLQDGGGLMLKRTESGGKWTYRYALAGRRRDMGLGSLPDVSLSDARKEALLHKSADSRGFPFPGQTYSTASVTGMPSAV